MSPSTLRFWILDLRFSGGRLRLYDFGFTNYDLAGVAFDFRKYEVQISEGQHQFCDPVRFWAINEFLSFY